MKVPATKRAIENLKGSFPRPILCLFLLLAPPLRANPPIPVPEPDVAVDSAGNFLVVWDQPAAGGRGIFGRFVDSSGTGIGGPFQVSSDLARIASLPSVARVDEEALASEFVVVWQSVAYQGATDTTIHQASFTLDLATPAGIPGGEFVLATTDAGTYPFHPALSSTGDGRFLVLWAETSGVGPNRISGTFTDGGPAAPFSFDTATPNELLLEPDVALAADGRAVVSWAEDFEIVGAVLDPTATAPPTLETLNLFTAGLEGEPAVAVRGGGTEEFLAVWRSETPNFEGIFGRAFDAQGGSPQIQINTATAGNQRTPDLAVDALCNAEVVWLDEETNRVVAQRFDSQNRFLGSEIEVSAGRGDGTPFGAPRVVAAPDGRFFVTWANAAEIFVHTLEPTPTGRCAAAGGADLSLANGRFRVEVVWEDFAGNTGGGRSVPLFDSVGAFWFFRQDNLELFIKIIPGGPDRFWFYAGALTNVGMEIQVTDTVTGETRSYASALGVSMPTIRDTWFVASPVSEPESSDALSTAISTPRSRDSLADETCVLGGRFCFRVDWSIDAERSGTARGERLGDLTAYHWFFQPQNVETFFKVIDGCDLNNHYWVFGTGMTDLAVQVTVTDTATGQVKVYSNPPGPFLPVTDTQAFATCP